MIQESLLFSTEKFTTNGPSTQIHTKEKKKTNNRKEKKRKEKTESALRWYSSKELLLKFWVIHRSAPAPEPLFHKIVFVRILQNFEKNLFYRTLLADGF